MAVNPIIFDLKYTPYKLKVGATEQEIQDHKRERAFYDMSGEKNILDYIKTENKRKSEFTNLDYLQKSTGVFNQDGMIPSDELERIKERAKNNKGNIWHGFISLNKEDSPKINTPEKCIELVKRTFNSFFKDGNFNPKNIDLICSLHLDRPHHLHIHFTFFEKEPKFYTQEGDKVYRAKGKVEKKAIDNMFVRIAEFLSDSKVELAVFRDNALGWLKEQMSFKNINCNDEILEKVIELSKRLPKKGRLSYASEEMKPFREQIDKVVAMLVENNKKIQKADRKFYEALEKRKQLILDVCRTPHKYSDNNSVAETPSYRYKIDEKNITVIEDIEKDYKRRQGNLVLGLAKVIKAEYYERSKKHKYKSNSRLLKRKLGMSSRKIKGLFKQFILSFSRDMPLLEREFSNRLQEIEEEMEKEHEEQNVIKENYEKK